MATGTRTVEYCELVARGDAQNSIELKDGEIKILDGGQEVESNCLVNSQVEVCLDQSRREVRVRCIGNSSCIAGDTLLGKDEQTILGPGAVLELLPVKQTYVLFFGQRVLTSDNTVSAKRQLNNNTIISENKPAKKSNTQLTLKSFFSFSSSNSTFTSCKWRKTDSLLTMTYGDHTPSVLIASFDLDGTITETKSGRLPFQTTPDDWRFLFPCVRKKLKAVHSAGYKLVIFTNQGGMNYGSPSEEDFKLKLQAVMESLGDLPVILFAAIGDNEYRKPGTGMWDYFIQHNNGGVAVDIEQSYYIGDAAGRVRNWKKGCKKDFSCSDRKFAANVGIPFHTPDEFFLGEPPTQDFSWNGFNPFALDYNLDGPIIEPVNASILSSSQEVVIFVGCPASGKTTFYQTHMSKQYSHINRDRLGTWEKCISETQKVLRVGRSVVIDNTSPDITSRNRYIELVKTIEKDSIRVRCFLFQTPIPQGFHNNHYRELTTRDSNYKKMNSRAFDYYRSQYKEPTQEEGFDEIIKITINMKFTNPSMEHAYKKFYY